MNNLFFLASRVYSASRTVGRLAKHRRNLVKVQEDVQRMVIKPEGESVKEVEDERCETTFVGQNGDPLEEDQTEHEVWLGRCVTVGVQVVYRNLTLIIRVDRAIMIADVLRVSEVALKSGVVDLQIEMLPL